MKNETLVIVEHHHQVIPAWGAYRRSLAHAPRLITLDHHTDTSPPFRNLLNKTLGSDSQRMETTRRAWLAEIDFRRPESLDRALARLGNDEHVVTAIRADLIASAFVIAHNAMDTDLVTYREHRIMCRAVDRKPGSNKAGRADCDRVLEASFLKEAIAGFDAILAAAGERPVTHGAYVLDIDLDYFNTRRSLEPSDASVIRDLAAKAGLITVATEPSYVRHCALDHDLTSDELLVKLKKLLEG